jgi:hypothetical protein
MALANDDPWNTPVDPSDPAAGGGTAPDPWSADERGQAQQWAQDYVTSHQIPASWGNADDLANIYLRERRNGATHDAALATMQNGPNINGWAQYAAPTPGAPAPAAQSPAAAPAAGGGGGTIAPITGTPDWFPKAPTPNLPTFTPAAPYHDPNYADALNDPGYQFEASEGQRALEQSAAARGVLNGGGTLKDVSAWGQNFAAQRVNDVRDRSVNNYLLNYQTQTADPYKYAYQNALDTFNGNYGTWQTNLQAAQRYEEDVWNRRLAVGMG